MKGFLIFPLLLLSILSYSQDAPLVSMNGIGEIRIGMKKAALEKLLNKPLPLMHFGRKNDESYEDTAHVVYKGIDMDVFFQQEYGEDKKVSITVSGVRSSSPLLKTRSGITIGDDKIKVITTYESYTMNLVPEYETDGTTKSKTRSTIWLLSDQGSTAIMFHLTNNRITGFSVRANEGC